MKKGENMKKFFCVLCGICLFYMGYAQEKEVKAVIETNLGNMIVKLYNDTPNHRDNFVRLAKAGHYDGSLFYRVIKNFVIQGGSSDSKKAIKGAAIGYGKPIVIDAEIKPEHYHKKGALAAPRQPDRVNFFKESDISQFYIVQGRKYDPKELDIIEKQVNVPIKRAIQRKYYTPEKKAILDTLRKQKKVKEFREIAEKIKQEVDASGLTLMQILLTHGHLDHVGAAAELAQHYGVPVIGPEKEDEFWLQGLPAQSRMFGLGDCEPLTPDRWLNEGDRISVGNVTLQVLHCPGHTPGHVVFFDEQSKLLISGDVIFKGGVGRSDFPRGDHSQLIDSIKRKLLPLGDDVTFIPGHGPLSTLGNERLHNPLRQDEMPVW